MHSGERPRVPSESVLEPEGSRFQSDNDGSDAKRSGSRRSSSRSFANVQSIVLADYRGIDVPTVTGAPRRVPQGRLPTTRSSRTRWSSIAVKGTAVEPMSKLLDGPDGGHLVARSRRRRRRRWRRKFAKEQEKFVIRGGFFDGQVLDAKGVESLATMPGKDELRAMLLMTFLAPPHGLRAARWRLVRRTSCTRSRRAKNVSVGRSSSSVESSSSSQLDNGTGQQ